MEKKRKYSETDWKKKVQNTADVISTIRFYEGKKENPVIYDPFSHLFISPEGERMLSIALKYCPFFPEYLAVRDRFFDDQLDVFFRNEDSDQLVILGAGNDMRGERLDFLKKKKVFEVDFAQKIKEKEEVLISALGRLPENVISVAADLESSDFLKLLADAGFNSEKRSAFLLQGLIYYLKPETVDNVFQKLSKLPSRRNLFLIDHASTDISPDLRKGRLIYPEEPLEYLSSMEFSIKEYALLGDLTEQYYGKHYKERWWVIAAVK